MQYGPVAGSLPCGWVGSIEQGLHLFLDQIRHQTSIRSLKGDRQNAANLLHCAWFTVLEEPKERPDGSQADISRFRGVATRSLQMLQETANQGSVQLLQH
jgi:hypothetical protein